ncbi:anaphase-promoting complex subunit 4-like isoform X2 [Argiope bruennichi]|uniref:Anaphase-promoting complex subunit 4 n=2 Tax=Argiope bruennichi TaxID=94029 RepID=A0A8T0ETM8_ARGBR|nr:anaphase-promoting complex subunit 4-like isoform X2 [Argiope bruennichi]KAF8781593.1 Anaphase-promoting complex subunit 4 like protein [Argiope bruennichi]
MSSFRQLEQRHVNTEITLMEWNPMLDLIALATVNGEVLLHRLSWQKVWAISTGNAKEKNVQVTALAWRPDGKILAYAFETGKITLCDVENSEAVHLLDVHCMVTSLTWVQCMQIPNDEYRPIYTDRSKEFLQRHFTLNKGYGVSSNKSEEVADDFKRMKGQKELNILAIGMEIGVVHLHSFGMFPTGFVDVNIEPEEQQKDRVISVTMSQDFRILTVILERKDNEEYKTYYYRSYLISLIYDSIEEIKIVSLKFGQISSLLTYLSSTIRAISEAWEDILLEIDTKLHNYAHQKHSLSEGSISDDFLELLMFGNPSDSLEKFLMHDLTESGLKKFGHSIELSYSNIQKLVLKRLQNVSISLFYHLNELRGMAMWTEQFGPLGLEESLVHKAVLTTGSFLLKATEIQQVIDNSMKNFKAFFRWLYSVILRLSDEPIPLEISRLTQQDLNFVAEFLKENFTIEYDENKKTTVKLERVAQYLKKEDLQYPASTTGSPWIKFLKDNPQMMESGLVFPNYPEKSLVTMYGDLRKVIDSAVKGPWNVLHETTSVKAFYSLGQLSKSEAPPKMSHMYCPSTGILYTAVTNSAPPCTHFYLLREWSREETPKGVQAIGLTFRDFQSVLNVPSSSANTCSEICKNYKILDLKFYNKDTITVLLMEDLNSERNFPVLLQFPLNSVSGKLLPAYSTPGVFIGEGIPILDATPYIDKSIYKRLENIKALEVAVSGSRKVACVLFASKRQVRLFEMDVEEEEEEEETEHEESMKDVSKEEMFSDDGVLLDKQEKDESL